MERKTNKIRKKQFRETFMSITCHVIRFVNKYIWTHSSNVNLMQVVIRSYQMTNILIIISFIGKYLSNEKQLRETFMSITYHVIRFAN